MMMYTLSLKVRGRFLGAPVDYWLKVLRFPNGLMVEGSHMFLCIFTQSLSSHSTMM